MTVKAPTTSGKQDMAQAKLIKSAMAKAVEHCLPVLELEDLGDIYGVASIKAVAVQMRVCMTLVDNWVSHRDKYR